MRAFRLITVAWLAGTAGCFPVITHGARVEKGASIGLAATTTGGDTHTEGDEGGIYLRTGPVGAYAGYGWEPTSSNNPGFYLGVAVPVLFPATQVDAYLQAPPAWTGALQAGIGGTVNYESGHAYAILGRQDAGGTGWSAHAGYGVRGASSSFLGRSPALFGGGAAHFAFRRHGRLQLYMQGAWGRDPESCFSDPPGAATRRCTPGRSSRALTAGAALGWHK
ncbi:MAG: hypothetical protein ACREBE_21600 [bacterium]